MTLKRSGFKPPTPQKLKELKERKYAKAVIESKATKPPRASKLTSKGVKKPKGSKSSKNPHKGYKPPKWFTSIPLGSHGNNPAQKKYWKVVSETYRKEDFEKHNGKCVSCPAHLERWQDGQLAHFKAWSVCNAWFKYERKNLALSCPNCNRLSDGVIGHNFSQELKRRHGEDITDWIEAENLKYRSQKMEVWQIVEKVSQLRPDLVREKSV